MNQRINSFSKEAIKARMQQNAVKLWGLRSVSSIDPFVSLLIDAFSTEIFKANNEIRAVNSRILEKLAKLLTPSIYTHPQPAHAIAFTHPDAAQEVISHQSEFYIKRQFPSTIKSASDAQVDIHFTPVDNVSLVRMNTTALLTTNTFYIYDDEQNKIPIAKIPQYEVAHNKIYLGIDATLYNASKLPESLTLYCSNPTFESVDFVFKLLPFISIKNNGENLKVKSGLPYKEDQSATGYEKIFKAYSVQNRIEQNIKNIYNNKFIEISGFSADCITEELPEFLDFAQNQREVTESLQGKKMIWIEMEFPPQYSTDILDNFSFSLNAFPIYNRKWKRNEYALDIMGDNIPLHTSVGEHFLYVEEVIDSHGNKYKEVPFQQNNGAIHKGLYTVRKGGMERFNERNAIELISNVMEVTRDEVSAFGVLERDKVIDTLRNITTQMKEMEQKISNVEKNVIQETTYAIVNPYERIENLFAGYWVTHCLWANNIRSGTSLSQPKVTAVKFNKNIKLLTVTSGGNEGQKGTDAIQAYKYALTTRDKLISIEDIKNFCKLSLKNEFESIDVKRGTIISDKPKESFIRTIEIEIVPKAYNYLGEKYWANTAISLKQQIMLRGIDGIEYLVKIKNEENE